MRLSQTVTTLFVAVPLMATFISAAAAEAVPTKEAAVQRARAEGYVLVSKAEEAQGTWDVWASRDGIAYEIKIDAHDGSVIAAMPLEAND